MISEQQLGRGAFCPHCNMAVPLGRDKCVTRTVAPDAGRPAGIQYAHVECVYSRRLGTVLRNYAHLLPQHDGRFDEAAYRRTLRADRRPLGRLTEDLIAGLLRQLAKPISQRHAFDESQELANLLNSDDLSAAPFKRNAPRPRVA